MKGIHTDSDWSLAAVGHDDGRLFFITLPVSVVGRDSDAEVRIKDSSVSKFHARFFVDGERLLIEDLGSTNGTFVNGTPISRTALAKGDLIQFANLVFRLERQSSLDFECTIEELPLDLANRFINFDRLMTERVVTPLFQPIVSINNGKTVAFEMLISTDLENLETAAEVFGTAAALQQEAALSELLREKGASIASQSQHADLRYFFNIDPSEFGTDRLTDSLVRLHDHYPDLKLTLEVHEKAVTELSVLKKFHRKLHDLDIQLAFDDFGAGQGRLLELTEMPPDVVKFDMRLIHDLDKASTARLDLMRSLVKAATACGTLALAECIETEKERDVCIDLGFQLAQGYYYGRPQEF